MAPPATAQTLAPGRVGLAPPVIVGLVIIALFFGGFGSWAALAPLESAAMAPGVVSVFSNRKTVQHLEGGIIEEILVREGDVVRSGQLLVRLDDTQTRATLERMRGRYAAVAALEARLLAERDGRETVEFAAELSAARADPNIAEVLDGQINIFKSRRTSLAGQIAILKQRIAQSGEEIAGLQGQIAAEDVQIELIAEDTEMVRQLLDKGYARRPRLLELQRRAAEIAGARSQNVALIARAGQNIGEADLRISDLQATRLDEVMQLLHEAQNELNQLDEQVRAAEDMLRRTEIRAQRDGTIVDLQVHTAGGVIVPGARLLDIVPSDDRLVIEARIEPDDIDVVEAGLPARVRLTAFSQRNLKPIEARVMWVSADRLVDERTGEAFFLAWIELTEDPAEVIPGGALYPGMAAEVMIATGERTALDYLLSPIIASVDRAFREN